MRGGPCDYTGWRSRACTHLKKGASPTVAGFVNRVPLYARLVCYAKRSRRWICRILARRLAKKTGRPKAACFYGEG